MLTGMAVRQWQGDDPEGADADGADRGGLKRMFVQDFAVVERPFDEVAARFDGDRAAVLAGAFAAVRLEGERLRLRVGLAGWPSAFAKTVELTPGPVRELGDGLLVAFRWEAVGSSNSLFPRLDADLQVAPFGTDQTVVTLRGRYEPPAGQLGRLADQLVLHRLAESTMRAFLAGVCARLVSAAPDAPAEPASQDGEGPGLPGGE